MADVALEAFQRVSLTFCADLHATVLEVAYPPVKTFDGCQPIHVEAEADTVHVAKGKKVVSFDMKRAAPSDAELLAVMLGPTGNLRAPTWRKGRTLVVGFDEATYTKVLKL